MAFTLPPIVTEIEQKIAALPSEVQAMITAHLPWIQRHPYYTIYIALGIGAVVGHIL